jgi:hypothetical protein
MLKLNLLQRLGQSGAVDNKALGPRRLLSERDAYCRQKQTGKQERASRHHYKYANYEFRTRRNNPRDCNRRAPGPLTGRSGELTCACG